MDSDWLLTISRSDSLFSDYDDTLPEDQDVQWIEMSPVTDLIAKKICSPFTITADTKALTDEQMQAIINSFDDMAIARKIANGNNPLGITFANCTYMTPYCTKKLAKKIVDYWNDNAILDENWF